MPNSLPWSPLSELSIKLPLNGHQPSSPAAAPHGAKNALTAMAANHRVWEPVFEVERDFNFFRGWVILSLTSIVLHEPDEFQEQNSTFMKTLCQRFSDDVLAHSGESCVADLGARSAAMLSLRRNECGGT